MRGSKHELLIGKAGFSLNSCGVPYVSCGTHVLVQVPIFQ